MSSNLRIVSAQANTTDWFTAGFGTRASPARNDFSSVLGEQINAQYFACVFWSCNAHCGLAVTPAGTSFGQKMPRLHFGEQKAPATPVTVTLTSPVSHGPSNGSP